MNNKQKYRKFCQEEKSLPIFLTYKWLELVAPGQWDVIIEKKDNTIIGVFPYVLLHKKGFYIIDLPPLTMFGGAWIKYPENISHINKLQLELVITDNLISQLPKFDSFNQKFNLNFQNWLPFYWKGYVQTTRYTYIIRKLTNQKDLFNSFSQNLKRNISKAIKNDIKISKSDNIIHLLDLKVKVQEDTGLNIKVSEEYLKKIYQFCINENCGELLIAYNDNDIHSAALIIWDNNSAYYLYGVTNPLFKNTGSMSLLLWEAIKRTSDKVKEFNFEGSMIEGVERFFRGFGAEQVPYFQIKKTNSKLLKALFFIREF